MIILDIILGTFIRILKRIHVDWKKHYSNYLYKYQSTGTLKYCTHFCFNLWGNALSYQYKTLL
jgi:hypothetical protein